MGSEYGDWGAEPDYEWGGGSSGQAVAWDAGYSPLPSQGRFHASASKYRGFSGPVGSGKSAALCREALRLAYANPGLPGIIGAPTYPMLRDVTRAAFLELVEAQQVPHVFRASDNECLITECGSLVRFRSLDKPTSLVGANLAWFGVDELTYCKQDAWRRLEARLRHPRAATLEGFAAWTPKGFDWVYDRFIGPKRVEGYEAIIAKPGENTHLPDDYYPSLGRSYDERFFAQEVNGEYISVFAGRAYHAFDRGLNVAHLKFDPSHPLCMACDFNVNPLCWALLQVIGDIIVVLEEIVLPDANSFLGCDEFIERSAKYWEAAQPTGWARGTNPLSIVLYGDATGNSRRSSSNQTDWRIVKEFFGRHADRFTVTEKIDRSNPAVKSRINSVNAVLKNHAGERRLLIDRGCTELIADMEQVGWATDTSGNSLTYLDDKDKARTHISDAVGYAVWKEFGLRFKGGPSSKFIGV